MSETLYIKMDQAVEVTDSKVTIGQIAELECSNQTILNKVKPIKILQDNSNEKQRYVLSIMDVIQKINENVSNVDIQNLGESDCVIEFKKQNEQRKGMEALKIGLVSIILFFGAGFSIMSFNNDISIDKMFDKISNMIIGNNQGKGILVLCYALGLAIGIIVFYNHFGGKKLSKDPTPIEVEMRKYEIDINTTLIDGHNRNDGNIDVK